jgi:hypothetical protein
MDLGVCPRCGASWRGGDSCNQCHFVAIGAGLDKLPKKKKRKARRYVEPGSTRGLFTTCAVALFVYINVKVQPWQNDWEPIKALFGKGRHHDVQGKWVVEKVIRHQGGLVGPFDGGRMNFGKDGVIKLRLLKGSSEVDAKGSYLQKGTLLAINDLGASGNPDQTLPTSLEMKLIWNGSENSLIAQDGGELVFLRRKDSANAMSKFLQLALKPGASNESRGGVFESFEKQGKLADQLARPDDSPKTDSSNSDQGSGKSDSNSAKDNQ